MLASEAAFEACRDVGDVWSWYWIYKLKFLGTHYNSLKCPRPLNSCACRGSVASTAVDLSISISPRESQSIVVFIEWEVLNITNKHWNQRTLARGMKSLLARTALQTSLCAEPWDHWCWDYMAKPGEKKVRESFSFQLQTSNVCFEIQAARRALFIQIYFSQNFELAISEASPQIQTRRLRTQTAAISSNGQCSLKKL